MKQTTRRWMLAYSIFFGLLSFFFVLNNFDNGYLLIFCIWSAILYIIILVGNLVYSFNRTTPWLQAVWKIVFPIVILGFIINGIIDLKYGPAAHRAGLGKIIAAYFFAFLIFSPTFKAHYAIGYGKEVELTIPRSKLAGRLRKGLSIIGSIFIGLLMFILFMTNLSLFLLTGHVTLPSDSDFAVVAKQGEPIAQAICDYRAEHGLLPLDFSDLIPAYLTNRPTQEWSFSGNELSHDAGIRGRVCYNFAEDAGWAVFGEGITYHHLDVPGPTNKEPALTGQALFNAQLAEYERRISHNPNIQSKNDEAKILYDDKISFLYYAGRQDFLRLECERDAGLFPDWWLPQIVLAEANSGDEHSERKFVGWVHQHPTFANYWYLSRYYRDKDDISTALKNLEGAATSPYEEYPDYTRWGGPAFAFDAAQFSYENRRYELTLKLCRNCEPDPGSWQSETLLEYETAAELKLAQFDAAITDAQKVVNISSKQPMDVQISPSSLQDLLKAAKAHDTNFIYKTFLSPSWPMCVKSRP